MMLRSFHYCAVVTMTTLSMDYSQTSMDNKHQHTLLAVELAGPKQGLDRRGDNEVHPETFAAESAGTKEMKLAVLSWEQMDIFLSHDDADDEDGC